MGRHLFFLAHWSLMRAFARSLFIALARCTIVGCLALFGCTGDDGGEPDAAMMDAGGDAGMAVLSPAPPVLTPCPDGWTERSAHGVTVCEPWASGTVHGCAMGEARFVGTAACAPIGAPCPAGAWAEDLPATNVLYVQPGAAPSGDGSRDAPFATIADAVARASSGTTIALARGMASEAVSLRAGVSLVGACTSDSGIEATSASVSSGVVTVLGEGAVVRNVHLSGERPGVVVQSGAVELHGVAVEGAREFGVVVRNGAHASGDRVVVRETRARATGESGAGLAVFDGSTVELAQVTLEGNLATGLWVLGAGSSAAISELALFGTMPQADGRFGQGVDVSEGGHITLDASVIERNVSGGITMTNAQTALVLRDSIIRDITRTSDGRLGRGLSLSEGSMAMLERVFVANTAEAGVFALGSGSRVEGEHLVVADTTGAEGDVIDGFGLGLEDAASAQVTLSLFAGNQTAGVSTRTGTPLVLSDVTIRDTIGRRLDGTLGQGIHVEDSAQLERVLLEDNEQAGLVIVGATADAEITDLIIRGTRGQTSDGRFGRGMYLGDGSHARATSVLVEDNHETGIGADGAGTSLTLESVVVRRTESEAASGQFGVGLVAQNGATVNVQGGFFTDNREITIAARGDGTTVELVDVEVRDTAERACATSSCSGAGIGVGLGAYSNAQLDARDFVVDGNALAGIQLAGGGTMDLHSGVVSSNPIGANIQTAGFDQARINDEVLYRDNQRNLDASGLPIPEPSSGL